MKGRRQLRSHPNVLQPRSKRALVTHTDDPREVIETVSTASFQGLGLPRTTTAAFRPVTRVAHPGAQGANAQLERCHGSRATMYPNRYNLHYFAYNYVHPGV